MNDWQYTNPFFLEGRLPAEIGESSCPYDPNNMVNEEDKKLELYRQKEWLSGFNSFEDEEK